MIDDVDRMLIDWIGSIADDAEVVLDLPQETGKKAVVSLHLFDLGNGVPTHRDQPAPLQIALRYLVSTWAPEPAVAHNLLGRLVFAAMENDEFEVDLDAVTADTWSAIGVPARPAFLLRVPLEQERAAAPFPRVRRPAEIRVFPTGSLAGVVVGPDEVPLPRARVELPALRLTTRTDVQGRFRFSAIPLDRPELELRVRLKGLEVSTNAAAAAGAEPLVIHFDPEEV